MQPPRRNYKKDIERFFRNHPFPGKVTEEMPKEKTTNTLKLGDLLALFEDALQQISDQRLEHKRTLRTLKYRSGK